MTTDKIIAAAREAGWYDLQLQMASPAELDRLAAFYALAYRAGMERAAEICDALKEKALAAQGPAQLDDLTNTQIRMVAHIGHGVCAEEIRAHAKNQPESTHDSSVV